MSKMRDIYVNAFMAISAANAVDCHDGFLRRNLPRTEPVNAQEAEPLQIPYRSLDGTLGSVQLRNLVRGTFDIQPIHKRCWTLQEHFLAKRVLHFGDQIGWWCPSGEVLNYGSPLEDGSQFSRGSIPFYRHPASERLRVGSSRDSQMKKFLSFFLSTVAIDFSSWRLLEILDFLDSDAEDVLGKEGELIDDPVLRRWISSSENINALSTAFNNFDIPAMLQAAKPLINRCLQILSGREPFQELLEKAGVRSAVETALAEMDGVKAAGIIFRSSIGLLLDGGLDQLASELEDIQLRGKIMAAIDSHDDTKIVQALLEPILEECLKSSDEDELQRVEGAEKYSTISLRSSDSENQLSDLKPNGLGQMHWYSIVEQYSQRSMSNPNDRLPALGGIAPQFALKREDTSQVCGRGIFPASCCGTKESLFLLA
jgi:hypothetical protein